MTGSFDKQIVRLLKSGAVGLLPSDTIYGLSCQALDRHATERIHSLKDRSYGKPFIILISDLRMLDLLSISRDQADIIKDYWPGGLSVVFKAPKSPPWLQLDTNTLAVRMPSGSMLRDLIAQVGPIISTSANIAGNEPASSAKEAQRIFEDQLDFYIDAGELNNLPSTLVIVESGQLKVIRQGAVKINDKEG